MADEKKRVYKQKMEDTEFQILKALNNNRQGMELEIGRQHRRLHALNRQADNLEAQRQGFLNNMGKKYGVPENIRWVVTNDGEIEAEIPEGMPMPTPPKKPDLSVVEPLAEAKNEGADEPKADEPAPAPEPAAEAPEADEPAEGDKE